MDKGTSIGDHLSSLNEIVSELESIGVKVEDEDKVLQFIWSHLSTFKHLQPTLMYGKETLSLEEVTSTLLSEGRRLKGSESLGENSIMVIRLQSEERYKSKFGKRTNKLATVTSNDGDEASLVMATDCSRYDKGWVFDSGSTMHICTHKAWFGKYTRCEGNKFVLTSNGSRKPISGVGDIHVRMFDERIVVHHDVQHVPSMTHNLI
ncbi:hypothetical protein GIB67_021453 [Kingdonia uniflora]|uniref:Retrovirus-related Pol polyprotein from transposon TNT 1-94-like beta-barrel domain-containing protein n=1 Tax=Kingdonia uniflora TaxID=39325 RepID=A0A7J7NQW8_9MAGN|nr:hypothetical protein GIB67_021453 [Kingdonia uniflora]